MFDGGRWQSWRGKLEETMGTASAHGIQGTMCVLTRFLRSARPAAEKTIAATKEAAMSNVRTIALEAAAAIVERLLGTAANEKSLSDAVSHALKR